jgi:hypothetical protein
VINECADFANRLPGIQVAGVSETQLQIKGYSDREDADSAHTSIKAKTTLSGTETFGSAFNPPLIINS